MRQRHGLPARQGGAVAVMTGLAAIVLVLFLGLTVDLGHAYVGTSELQNAADAAALAGAKELDQTAAGVTAAVNKAIAIAAQHNYNFAVPVSISIANIRLGSCPNASNPNSFGRPGGRSPSCSFVAASSVTSDAAAARLTFLEVDTSTLNLSTYFMRVVAINTTGVAGYAVAGRFVNDVTPIGVCAIDPANRTSQYTYPTGETELVEFGFRRGVTYNLFGLNPLAGGASDPYMINPVDTVDTGCSTKHSSANFTAPFMCTGGSAVLASGVGKVYTNSGMSSSLAAALNSRFDDFTSPSVCDPVSAPPDANVKAYHCKNPSSDPACLDNAASTPSVTPPIDWLEPAGTTMPNVEYVATDTTVHKPKYLLPSVSNTPELPFTAAGISQYGVLWSYGPAYQASGGSPPTAGAAFTPAAANATVMYNTTAGGAMPYFDTANYPAGGPYSQTGGIHFQAPPVHPPGVRNRRILNIVLVDCRNPPVGTASCGLMDAVGIARFFMQTPADFTGAKASDKNLDVEFVGLVQPVPSSEIKLYR